jgi:hypothetical protein
VNSTVPVADPDAAPETAAAGRPLLGFLALLASAALTVNGDGDGDRSTI